MDRSDWIKTIRTIIPTGIGVEIGTLCGEFAKLVLTNWPGKMYLIDPWRKLDDEEYEDFNNITAVTAYSDVIKNISGYENRAIMIRADSKTAVELFADGSLDFVYIDANHKYDFVKEDLNLWFPKVKKGGIFSGHDYLGLDWYNDPNFCPNGKDKYIWSSKTDGSLFYCGMFGVNPAVDEFCKENGYQLLKTDEWFGTWWLIK